MQCSMIIIHLSACPYFAPHMIRHYGIGTGNHDMQLRKLVFYIRVVLLYFFIVAKFTQVYYTATKMSVVVAEP